MAARQLDRDLAAGMEGPDLRPLRVESPVLLKAFGELEAHRARGDAPALRLSLEAYEGLLRRENASISANLGERWDTLGWLVALALLLGATVTALWTLVALREEHLRRALASAALLQARTERAELLKDRLLANTAHELRTPLAGMLGLVELAHAGEAERLPEALEHGYRLASLLSDLLDLARMQSGQSTFLLEPVDLAHLVDTAVIEPLTSEQTPVHTRIEVPAWLSLDPRRIVQVVGNLVSNATRHAPGHPVELGLHWEDGVLTVTVEDRGPGLGAEPSRLFDAFTQGDAPTAGGLGIGLAVVNETVRQWPGTLVAEAREGGGARFVVQVPVQPAEPPASRQAITAPPWASAPVWVIEDDPTLSLVTSRMLTSAGYRVVAHSSGEAALEHLDSPPLAALIDWQLPGIDGPETARRIRARGLRMPLIAVTARATPADIANCTEAGFDAHLSKPVHPRGLLEVLAGLLEPKDPGGQGG